MTDRTHRLLTDADIARIAGTYHLWRGDEGTAGSGEWAVGSGGTAVYADIPGFCKAATLAEIAAHGHVLTPGRYVGAEDDDGGDAPFDTTMGALVAELLGQQAEGVELDEQIRVALKGLGYEVE